MDAEVNKSKLWIWFTAALVMFTCFAIGILMVGGSIYYLECQRDTGQVNCVITTKFLGTFNTERREAINVTGVVEGQDCDQDNCRYRLELRTTTGIEPLSTDYSPESKAETVSKIEAFLADSSQKTLQIQVIFWRMFIVSVVFSFLAVSLERETIQPKPGKSSPLAAAAVAVGTLICPGYCLSTGIFIILLDYPWCPPELAQDPGLGDALAIPCILYFPFAALLSGLLGYALFRISRARLKTVNPLFLVVTSGVFSGLVFIVLYPVLLTMLFCMG